MDHTEKVKQMLTGGEPICPYCGMGVSRIITKNGSSAVCGWCDIKWQMNDERVIETEAHSTLIMRF
jgi:uncharacterized paraquat-inducible protein A